MCFLGSIIGIFFIDDARFGRRKLLIMGYFMAAVASYACFFCKKPNQLLFILLGITKLFINLTYMIVFTFTSELYDSSIRVTALGFFNSISKFGGIFMP